MTELLPPGIEPPARSWRDRAKCKGADPRLYELAHLRTNAATAVRKSTAAALCAGCPVLRDCAADAYIHEDIGVVRGGVFLKRPMSTDLIETAKGK